MYGLMGRLKSNAVLVAGIATLLSAAPISAQVKPIDGKTYWIVGAPIDCYRGLQSNPTPLESGASFKVHYLVPDMFGEPVYSVYPDVESIGSCLIKRAALEAALANGSLLDYDQAKRRQDEMKKIEDQRRDAEIKATRGSEPKDFRGIPWGASIEEVRKAVPNLPAYALYTQGDRVKVFFVPTGRVGDVAARFAYLFLDDKFAEVTIYFESGKFPTMRDAFVERYGKPTSTENIPMQTSMGAKYENQRILWEGKTIVIRLDRYSGKITDGQANIGTKEIRDHLVDVYSKKGKAAARDL
jgi:hypothetical protein